MSTRARVVQMEPPATTGGNALLVMVGLSVMFLLIVALLGAAKAGGSLYSESNLLYVALIFYAGAGALYMGFGVTGIPRYVKFASAATVIGLVANTLAVAHRWYLSGRPPFASVYEMLLSFVWTVAIVFLSRGVTLHRERKVLLAALTQLDDIVRLPLVQGQEAAIPKSPIDDAAGKNQ